jgi:hypothetical protein
MVRPHRDILPRGSLTATENLKLKASMLRGHHDRKKRPREAKAELEESSNVGCIVDETVIEFLVGRRGVVETYCGLTNCRPWAAQLTDYAPQRAARSASYKLLEVAVIEFEAFAGGGMH